MAGAEIGVVVDHHIAFVPVCQRNAFFNAAQIARDRADVHRRGIAFAQGVIVQIEQPRAQILTFADDRGIRHPVQHIAHLFRYRMQRPADNLQRDRINYLAHGLGLLSGAADHDIAQPHDGGGVALGDHGG